MASLSTSPTDVLNDVEAATVTTINADTYLGQGTTTLDGAITDSDTTITLTSLTNFGDAGEIQIEDERIKYTGTSGSDLTGCTRGYRETTAAEHADTTTTTNYNVATVHQKHRDLEAGRGYYQEEVPAIAVYAPAMMSDIGDTFRQWDQSIILYLQVVDIAGDREIVTANVQRLLSEIRRLMRYQMLDESGNLDGIADAVWAEEGSIRVENMGGVYRVLGESLFTVTLITLE